MSILMLALMGSADAAPRSLTLEVTGLRSSDVGWGAINDNDNYATGGLSYTHPFMERVSLVAGVHTRRLASNHWVGGDETTGSYELRWRGLGLSAGAKANAELWENLYPFVSAELLGEGAHIRLDEDRNDSDNLNEFGRFGMAPGVRLAAGFDANLINPDMRSVVPMLSADLGWAKTANINFGDYGSTSFGGLTFSLGAGVAF